MAERIDAAREFTELAESAAKVAERYFREVVGIPDEAIPALLAEYEKGPPGREHFERIAGEWQCKEAERVDSEWRTVHGPPLLPSPTAPLPLITVAGIRANIREKQQWWMEKPVGGIHLLLAHGNISEWWDAARVIEGAPPIPPMPPPLPGRVSDIQQALAAADVLLRWCDEADAPKHPVAPAAHPAKAKAAGKRSWTQPELDTKIRSEIEKYPDLIAAVKKGKTGAKRDARKMFGRNALAKRLGVKSSRMVSLSTPWQELADSLGLLRKSRRRAKVGLDVALEQKADADHSNVAAEAIRRETKRIIEGAIESAKGKNQKASFVSLLEKFDLGEVTDDQARRIVETL